MDRQNLIKKLLKDLKQLSIKLDYQEQKKRVFLEVEPNDIVEIVEYLFKKAGFRFVTASAFQADDSFEIFYHFSYDKNGIILNVQIAFPFSSPRINSITNVCPAANWIEREMHELYGIEFTDHPKMEPLISEGNWGKDEFPFRKPNNKNKVTT